MEVPCPLGVPGATIEVEDTSAGVAVVLRSNEHAEDLRERVADAAAQYGPMAHEGKGHDGVHGLGGRHGLLIQALPPVTTRATDIEGGARLEVVPRRGEDRDVVRAKLRARASELASTPCTD